MWNELPWADLLIIAVAHSKYTTLTADNLKDKLRPNGMPIDVKSVFNLGPLQKAGYQTWQL